MTFALFYLGIMFVWCTPVVKSPRSSTVSENMKICQDTLSTSLLLSGQVSQKLCCFREYEDPPGYIIYQLITQWSSLREALLFQRI